MRAGKLKKQIKRYRKVGKLDSHHQEFETEEAVDAIFHWAEFAAIGGDEPIQAAQQTAVIKWRVKTRYLAGTTSDMVLVDESGGRYQIEAVYDPDMRRVQSEMICRELASSS